eukprot:273603-Karenia_brevis.AAC.1
MRTSEKDIDRDARRQRRQRGDQNESKERTKKTQGLLLGRFATNVPKNIHDVVISSEPPRTSGAVPSRHPWNNCIAPPVTGA